MSRGSWVPRAAVMAMRSGDLPLRHEVTETEKRYWRISNRLAVALVLFAAAAVASGVTGWVAVQSATAEQRLRTETLLRSELLSRRDRVQTYLEEIAQGLRIVAGTRLIERGIADFESAFDELGDSATTILQRLYTADNPNPVGRKHALLRANDDSTYSMLHERYHDWLSKLATGRDYYDMFLIAANGDVVYTVFKESDFATNLMSGEYKDTELAKAFRQIRDDPRPGAIVFRDFVPYAPSKGLPAAFVGTPLIFGDRFVGVLIAQLKAEPFNELMKYSRIMGESGETYLVGSDFLLRSRSRFETESSVLRTKVHTASVKAALENTTGVHAILDYRGVTVLSAYAPLTWQGASWAVLAEIDQAEVETPIVALRWRLIAAGAACSLLAFVLGLLLAEREKRT